MNTSQSRHGEVDENDHVISVSYPAWVSLCTMYSRGEVFNIGSNEETGRKKILTGCLTVIVLLGAVWVVFNPPGRFGYHRFGLTVYSGIPFPVVDMVVDANGLPDIRGSKAHWVSAEEFDRLIGPRADVGPDMVIIGTGYQGRVQVEGSILTRGTGPAVEVLPTPQAMRRFNELRAAGKRVAAIIHSTC